MTTDHTITCPNCNRQVEAGFRFCDYCAARLVPAETAGTEPSQPDASSPAAQSETDKRAGDGSEPESIWAPPRAAPEAEPTDATDPPERPVSAVPSVRAVPSVPPLDPVDPVPPVPVVPSVESSETSGNAPAPRITSKPMTVEEMRDKGVGIAGRLRWREGEAPPGPEDTEERPAASDAPPVSWRPATSDDEARDPSPVRRSRAATVAFFLLHLVLAFVAGALLLAVAAVVASLASEGRVSLLEVRGLPIFIAGAVAIVVFAVLRTGRRAQGGRRAVAVTLGLGFLILLAAVAFAYQPALMGNAQTRLDRSLGVFGPDLEESVDGFTADVDQWNAEVDTYREDALRPYLEALDKETDPAKLDEARQRLSVEASASEEALDGMHKRMESHAGQVSHPPLRDALRDLVRVYGDELSAIRLITRGTVNEDQALTAAGDTRFKDATARAVELFEERVRPILERADIDPSSLEQSVGELRG